MEYGRKNRGEGPNRRKGFKEIIMKREYYSLVILVLVLFGALILLIPIKGFEKLSSASNSPGADKGVGTDTGIDDGTESGTGKVIGTGAGAGSGSDGGGDSVSVNENVSVNEDHKEWPSSCVENVTITSYFTVYEIFFDGEKIPAYNKEGEVLGRYKEDFLEQIKIDGAGLSDGYGNDCAYLHYDYGSADKGEFYYISEVSLNAQGEEITPWKSVAFWPPPELGTELRIADLGPDAEMYPGWMQEKLTNTVFTVDDRLYHARGNHLDVYMGIQKSKETVSTPYSLLFKGAVVCFVD